MDARALNHFREACKAPRDCEDPDIKEYLDYVMTVNEAQRPVTADEAVRLFLTLPGTSQTT